MIDNGSYTPAEQDFSQIAAQMRSVVDEVEKVIFGQRPVLESLLLGMVAGGHVLLEGVPGLGKTLTLNTMARIMQKESEEPIPGWSPQIVFRRIQFTPDLVPPDLTGTAIYRHDSGSFDIQKGPIFGNIILADEINRAPAKVQSALLEVMQERQVTLFTQTLHLDQPHFVLATQNPIEQEGTYPLPEAQTDRFMLKLLIEYPDQESELEVLDKMKDHVVPAVEPLVGTDDIRRWQQALVKYKPTPSLNRYILRVIDATRYPATANLNAELKNALRQRAHAKGAPFDEDKQYRAADYVDYGASPRASLALNQMARAWALYQQMDAVLPEHVQVIAKDVLRHRIKLSYLADADQVTSDDIIEAILKTIPV